MRAITLKEVNEVPDINETAETVASPGARRIAPKLETLFLECLRRYLPSTRNRSH